jgi:hypothetical protein
MRYKELRDFENVGEIETTRRYFNTLKKICKQDGLVSAIGYELSSTGHSFIMRMEYLLNMFVAGSPEVYIASSGGLSGAMNDMDDASAERKKYILRAED